MAYSYHNPGGGSGYSLYQSGGGSSLTSGQNDFNRLSEVIGTNIQKISQNVSSVEKWVNQLGTSQDSEQLRSQLLQIQHYTNQLAKDTNKHMKDLSHLPPPIGSSEQKQQKIQKERLTNDFSEALKNFQDCQRRAAQKEKDSVKKARANSGLTGDPFLEDMRGGRNRQLIDLASPSGGMQSDMTLQMEEDVNLEAIQERENAIKQLESDIVDVNTIFKDLATMVHEQGEMIDSIEANIDHSTINVQDATKSLAKARSSQSAARKKKFILICILVVVLAIIIGIIIWKTGGTSSSNSKK